MQTIWKEKEIGKVLGGYLEKASISIYKIDLLVVRNKNGICEYINKNSVIDYKVLDSTTKTKLDKAIIGDILFGFSGSLAMGKEEHYSIEITWVNNQKSLLDIVGTTYYQFFMSKLYEDGESILFKEAQERKIDKLISEKEQIKTVIETLEERYHLNKQNIDFNIKAIDLKEYLKLLPYYKAQYENNYDEIKKCEENIEEYSLLVDLEQAYKDIYSMYKNTEHKVIDCFIFDCAKRQVNSEMSDKEKINEIKEWLPFEDLYSDSELLLMLPKSEKENVDYFIKEFINNEFYDYLYNLHKRNGYIYVDKNEEVQKSVIKSFEDKIPFKLYDFLNKILERKMTYERDLFVVNDLLRLYPFDDKIVAPSHFLISYFLNCYFGKEKRIINNNKNKYDDLKKVKELYDIGAISLEEFNEEKKKILNS